MMPDYAEFLATKAVSAEPAGFTPSPLPDHMFDYQQAATRFCIERGRAALFLGTGLGKTICELEYSAQCVAHTGRPALILTPLAVARQIEREGHRFGYTIRVVRDASEVGPGINVCNYDRLDLLDVAPFGSVVLDEASILKSFMGKTSRALIERFASVPYRLAATATPAPNDHIEIGTQSEFLGVMPRQDMLLRWFINDTADTGTWRLKGHAAQPFWDWCASWAVMAESPADMGFDGSRHVLPPLQVHRHRVEGDTRPVAGSLFAGDVSATGIHDVKRQTAAARAQSAAELVHGNDRQWLIWVDGNYEADAVLAAIPEALDVRGSMTTEAKEAAIMGFVDGSARVLIGKPSAMGYGLNLQNCSDMIFLGRSFSYENWHQAVRRCWRFGQTKSVQVHLMVAEGEDQIGRVITKKADGHAEMANAMRAATLRAVSASSQVRVPYNPSKAGMVPAWMNGMTINCLNDAHGDNYAAYNGDCVDVLRQLSDHSVGFSVYSPPFSNMYSYNDSEADMGNCVDDTEFFKHYDFVIKELTRVTKPGRLSAVHCSDIPLSKWKDGVIGIKDFSGDIIRAHQAHGWVLHSRVTIWKDPVVEMTRTKALGLLYKQLQKDSTRSRQGMADYVLVFRAPGENAEPVGQDAKNFPVDQWQQWASPVWMDIRQTNTLNVAQSREDKDERHLCPLQLDLIERAILLWSNPGDVVLSPFMGVGSEGHVALKHKRRFVGVELKGSYFKTASRNLNNAERNAMSLFDVAAA
jgi:DNA modification methylase